MWQGAWRQNENHYKLKIVYSLFWLILSVTLQLMKWNGILFIDFFNLKLQIYFYHFRILFNVYIVSEFKIFCNFLKERQNFYKIDHTSYFVVGKAHLQCLQSLLKKSRPHGMSYVWSMSQSQTLGKTNEDIGHMYIFCW